MTIIVLDGQGGGIGRAIITALLPKLPEGVQLLCVGTNAMATAAMLKAGAQRGATGENAVRWAAKNADILLAPIALVLKDSMMGEITGDMAASVGSSSAVRSLMMVDFPEPDGPTRKTNSPSSIFREIPLSALTPGSYVFTTLLNSIMLLSRCGTIPAGRIR